MFGLKKKTAAAMPQAVKPVAWHRPAPGVAWLHGLDMLSEAHTLIAGSTGSGKSVVLNALVWSVIQRTPEQTRLMFVDMKMGLEMWKYRTLPHTLAFADNERDAEMVLDMAINTIEIRGKKMRETGMVMWDGADLYIIIDELADLLSSCGQSAFQKLIKISRIGRACKVHLVMATQDPSKRTIPAQIQQNMTCCLGLGCRDAIQSRQIIGMPGCEQLPPHGEGLLLQGRTLRKLAIPMIPEADIAARIAYWSNPANYTYYK